MSNLCENMFLEGIQDRKKRPLSKGVYKIEELNDFINYSNDRLLWIKDLKQKKVSPHWYGINPIDENNSWVKIYPLELAYNLGFIFEPSIEALAGDGVPSKVIARIKLDFLPSIKPCIDECGKVYSANRIDINHEYNDMIVGRLSPTQLLNLWIGEAGRNLLYMATHTTHQY